MAPLHSMINKPLLTRLGLYRLFMSNDRNLGFPFSPFAAIPDNVDMLSAGNHLEEKKPVERTRIL